MIRHLTGSNTESGSELAASPVNDPGATRASGARITSRNGALCHPECVYKVRDVDHAHLSSGRDAHESGPFAIHPVLFVEPALVRLLPVSPLRAPGRNRLRTVGPRGRPPCRPCVPLLETGHKGQFYERHGWRANVPEHLSPRYPVYTTRSSLSLLPLATKLLVISSVAETAKRDPCVITNPRLPCVTMPHQPHRESTLPYGRH